MNRHGKVVVMKYTRNISAFILALSISSIFIPTSCTNTTAKVRREDTRFAQQLPDFSLADPTGEMHTNKSVSENGVVLVITAPILSQSDDQEKWARLLLDSKSGSKAQLVFIEDLQPSTFKGIARSKMKDRFEPGKEPLLLLDENGKLRRAFKVIKEDTVILVYDKNGRLIHAESGNPSAAIAAAIWKKLTIP